MSDAATPDRQDASARPEADEDLIGQCRRRSLALLRLNTTPHGILAATRTAQSERRHYAHIFGRDAAVCALGMAVSGDAALRECARNSLLTLAHYQAENGQLPKYVDAEQGTADFWYFGCIDATLWWLIAVKLLSRLAPDCPIEHEVGQRIERAIAWLRCQEHQSLYLLQQNEASDWADIMPRSGFVLYTNALWYYVKRLYHLSHREETHYFFNHLFFPFSGHVTDQRRARLLMHYVRNKARRTDAYLSFVNFSFWGEEGDVFGNLLAVLLGLAGDGQANRVMHALEQAQVATPYPVRVVCKPIRKDSALWRTYMLRHRQNLEYQYHNGGIWPFVGGFWVMALARLGRARAARAELAKLAQANRVKDWQFIEWLHGKTLEPRGMAGQSWNAAMFLLADHALRERVF